MTKFERWTLGLSVFSLFISVVGFALLYVQLRSTNESLKTGIYTNMSVWTFEIDKAFLAHPDLRPYFYEGKDIGPDDPNFNRAVTLAEFILDNFDSMLEFKQYFPGGAPHEGWTNWMYDTFDQSPLLRRHIEERRRWYEPGRLWAIYQKWMKDHTLPSNPSKK